MKTLFQSLVTCGTLLLASSATLAAPVNDICDNASPVTVGTGQPFTMQDATPTSGITGCAVNNADVWFLYTPSISSGIVRITTFGSQFTSAVAAFNTCGGSQVSCITINSTNALSLTLTPGQTYLLRVVRGSGAGFNGVLGITELVVPTNDACNTPLPVGPGQYDFNTALATKDGTASCLYSESIATDNVDIWYQYTAASTGTAVIELTNCGGSGSNTNVGGVAHLSVRGSGCGSADLDCSPNGCSRPLSISVVQGQSYLIRVAPYVGGIPGISGAATLKISEIAAVPNDNCAASQPITEGNVYAWNTYGATTERIVTCATSAYHKSSHDLWYEFTAPAEAVYDFTVLSVGNNLAPGLSLHVNCGGAAVGCVYQAQFSTTPRLSRLMFPGEKIYLRLGLPVDYFQFGSLSGYLSVVSDLSRGYDTCGNALNVSAGSTSFDINSAMAADGTATCGSGNTGPDAYFRFTAGSAGTYSIDTCGSTLDTALSVSIECGSGEIACNGDTANPSACSTVSLGSSALDVNLTAGQIVYIRVASRNAADRGVGILNITAPVCAADFNDDGVRDVADLFAYINAWLAKTTNADFNDDSTVDVADLFAYINAWLAGC